MADDIVDTSIEETEAPVTDSTPVEQTQNPSEEKEIMVPKFRLDEVSKKYKELKDQKKDTKEKDLELLIDQKLAPMRVQIETDSVLRKYSDFENFATPALNEIKRNPSLSLEDGYLLAKAKTVQSTVKEEGKSAHQQKESLQFESSGPKKVARPIDDILKDRDVPLAEIAKMLPRS